MSDPFSYGLDISLTFEPIQCMQEGSVVYIDNQLFAYRHPDSSKYLRKTHLAADDDQGKYFPSVAEVEQVDDAEEDLKDDGRGGGDEVHCLSPKVVDVLGNQKGGNKPETCIEVVMDNQMF